mmetsp:Transcript_22077/g.54627  ORF Transcript_22077/g.54627 Transcript_22077/m.54627 type:complete len:261 (+) Transcript_22077:279-1061(+)
MFMNKFMGQIVSKECSFNRMLCTLMSLFAIIWYGLAYLDVFGARKDNGENSIYFVALTFGVIAMLGKTIDVVLFESREWTTDTKEGALHTMLAHLHGDNFAYVIEEINLNAMMQGVEDSVMFMMFLTDGACRSDWVLKEVRKAMELGKPVFVLQEEDPRHGGDSSLKTLMDQAPPDVRDYLFNDDVIVYRRRLHEAAATFDKIVEIIRKEGGALEATARRQAAALGHNSTGASLFFSRGLLALNRLQQNFKNTPIGDAHQ